MRKFEPKHLKPGVDIGLRTPNPEGFWITPKTLRDISILLRSCSDLQGGGPPLEIFLTTGTEPFKVLETRAVLSISPHVSGQCAAPRKS